MAKFLQGLVDRDKYAKLKQHRSEGLLTVDFDNVHNHPVLGDSVWLSDQAFLNSLGVMKRKKGLFQKDNKIDVIKDFWGRICMVYGSNPCDCPPPYRGDADWHKPDCPEVPTKSAEVDLCKSG